MADKVYVLKAESLSTSLGHGAKVKIFQNVKWDAKGLVAVILVAVVLFFLLRQSILLKPLTIEVRRCRFSVLLAARTPEGEVKSKGAPSRLQHTPPASCRINEAAAKSHGERRYSKYSSQRPIAR
jgi:hypothetical protein